MNLSRWRFAARLARREVRRRPGRTLLVTVLVAVPIMAMTVASVLAHTVTDPWAEDFARSNGAADMVGYASTSDAPDDATLDAALPDGSTWERANRVYVTVRNDDQRVDAEVTDISLMSPITQGVVELREGSAPATGDEVAVDADTADQLGLAIGDTLTLTEPAGSWEVTGIVRDADRWGQHMIVFGDFDWNRCSPGLCYQSIYVDLPSGTTTDETTAALAALNRTAQFEARDIDPSLQWRSDEGGNVRTETMAWGWVIGALALCVLGIIIASAFATSARRQLVTLGQLSSNGADQTLLRRTMAMQGSWSGLIGSVTGVAVALVGLVAGRGVIERLAQRHLGAYEVVATDLVIIGLTGVAAATIAALVPARSIAKVPVMAALSGRRPLGAVPRRLIPIGLALFGGGLFLLVIAATGSSEGDGTSNSLFAAVAVLGGLGVLFGMCCLTPRAVDALGSLGSRCAGSWRLSARSLARTRTRSAGVVTAVAAAGALAVGGSAVFASTNTETSPNEVLQIPDNAVFIAASLWSTEEWVGQPDVDGVYTTDPPGYVPVDVPHGVVDEVRGVVDGDDLQRRVALWDPAAYEVDASGYRLDGKYIDETGVMVVADPAVLDLIGLSAADRARLADTGVMNLQGAYADGDVVIEPTFTIQPEGREPITVEQVAPNDPIDSTAAIWPPLVTPERAEQLGLDIAVDGLYIVSDSPLDDDQLDALQQIQNDQWNGGSQIFDVPAPEPGADNTRVNVSITPSYREPVVVSETLVSLIISAAALIFTLLVVAVGLALSAAESRDERDVLVAVGAKPSTMRQVAGQKAALLALAGTVLAVPTGFLPVVMVLRSLRQQPGDLPLDIPWIAIGMLIVSVPIAAGLVTWLSSAIAQRVRPVRMSTLARD